MNVSVSTGHVLFSSLGPKYASGHTRGNVQSLFMPSLPHHFIRQGPSSLDSMLKGVSQLFISIFTSSRGRFVVSDECLGT